MKSRTLALLLASAALVGLFGRVAAADKGTVVKLGDLKSTTPDTWKAEKPSSSMRLEQFALPRADGDANDGEIAIFKLGGATQANIARWKSQFILPEGKKPEEVVKETKMKVGDAEVTYLDIRGTYKSPPFDPKYKGKKMADYRMLGVIFEAKDGTYQIRCLGPEKTIAKYKAGFDGWIKGFK